MTTERMDFIRELRPNTIRIRLHRKIGQGLSSHVYEAQRIDSRGHTSQAVAVKITKSQDDIDGLKREFETLLQVQSAHLVKVFAWDNHGDESLLSMELIDGLSLADIFEANVLDLALIEEIITQMQEGLRALDAKGLKHGDVSLNNVLITRDGVVKLIDFANPDRMRDYIHGTPPYVAPEVWSGDTNTIESDLFALGMIREDLISRLHDQDYSPPDSIEPSKLRCSERVLEFSAIGHSGNWLSMSRAHRLFSYRQSSPQCQLRLGELVCWLKSSIPAKQTSQISECAEASLLAAENILSLQSRNSAVGADFRKSVAHEVTFAQRPLRRRERVYSFVGMLISALLLMSGCWDHRTDESIRYLPIESMQNTVVSSVSAALAAQKPIAVESSPNSKSAVERAGKHQGRANTPMVSSSLSLKSTAKPVGGRLRIRTHRWIHIFLGDQELGYAPLSVANLRPGTYRLKWQTQSSRGTKRVEIRNGQESTLQDSDF